MRATPIETVVTGTDLQKALSEVFPAELATSAVRVSEADAKLPSDDRWRKMSETYAAGRQREFIAGRRAAVMCLEALSSHRDCNIGMGENREPMWPPGYSGSITHTREWALAVAAHDSVCKSLGIDLEYANRLSLKAWRMILCRSEIRWVETHCPVEEYQWWGTLYFSLKECFYKWQYPLTRQWLGFHDVEVIMDSTEKTGSAKLKLLCDRHQALANWSYFKLHYAGDHAFVLTGMGHE